MKCALPIIQEKAYITLVNQQWEIYLDPSEIISSQIMLRTQEMIVNGSNNYFRTPFEFRKGKGRRFFAGGY